MVIRSSIERPRMASPVYSNTWPVPPPTPMREMRLRMMSLAVTPGSELAVDAHLVRARRSLEQRLGGQHHLDLGRADAERQRPERAVGRGVGVAAHDGHARLRQAQLGADDVDDALVIRAPGVDRDAELGAVALELRRPGTPPAGRGWAGCSGVVGVEWSAVATVRSGWRTVRPRLRRPWNAWGLVTSWTRWRSMPMTLGAPASSNTTWSSQIFWTSVRGAAAEVAGRVRVGHRDLAGARGGDGCSRRRRADA